MKSLYATHAALDHGAMTRYSPNGTEIIEECKVCPQSFLLLGDAHHFLPLHTRTRAERELRFAPLRGPDFVSTTLAQSA